MPPPWRVFGLLAAVAFAALAVGFGLGGVAGVAVAVGLVLLAMMLSYRATVVWWVTAREGAPTVVQRPDGTFDWYPAGHEPGTRPIGGVPRFRYDWEDPDRGPAAAVRLEFDVPDATPGKAVDRAVRWGLRVAAWRTPGRAKLRAKGAVVDRPGPDTRITVRLEVRGIGMTRERAERAADGFARGFLWRLGSGRAA